MNPKAKLQLPKPNSFPKTQNSMSRVSSHLYQYWDRFYQTLYAKVPKLKCFQQSSTHTSYANVPNHVVQVRFLPTLLNRTLLGWRWYNFRLAVEVFSFSDLPIILARTGWRLAWIQIADEATRVSARLGPQQHFRGMVGFSRQPSWLAGLSERQVRPQLDSKTVTGMLF